MFRPSLPYFQLLTMSHSYLIVFFSSLSLLQDVGDSREFQDTKGQVLQFYGQTITTDSLMGITDTYHLKSFCSITLER